MLPRDLSAVDVRILGSLVEKELTTPDHYPLSLNALTTACNQLTNRDPVMTLDEAVVSGAIDGLRRRGLVRSIQPVGSRVQKFQHLLTDVGELDNTELALLGVLALRGPQTQAELRTRAARLVPNADQAGIDSGLEALVNREPDALVSRLARRPGQKEVRYMHRLAGDDFGTSPSDGAPEPGAGYTEQVMALEEQVNELRTEVSELRRGVDELRTRMQELLRRFE